MTFTFFGKDTKIGPASADRLRGYFIAETPKIIYNKYEDGQRNKKQWEWRPMTLWGDKTSGGAFHLFGFRPNIDGDRVISMHA